MGEEWKTQYSIKFNTGDMLNVRADTAAELAETMAELGDNGPLILGIADTLRAEGNVVQTFPGSEAVTPGAPGVQLCGHNRPYERRSSKPGAAKKWSGLFCQVKDDPSLKQCNPIWDN